MADRADYLREMVDLVGRLVGDGYSRQEIGEIFAAAVVHLDGPDERPYAMGTCVNCGAVHVAWSEYQWAQVVRAPCRRCGKPW